MKRLFTLRLRLDILPKGRPVLPPLRGLHKATFGWGAFTLLTMLFAFGTSVSATAGDILRGGAANAGTPRKVGSVNSNSAASTARAKAKAQDRLARTTQALDAVKVMQAQARAVARGVNNLGPDPNHPGQTLPNVPNGLKPGGLEVATGATEGSALWTGANLPTEKQKNGLTIVTVEQTQKQALLNWNTFNIGSETKLRFDQTAGKDRSGQWIAFNKINDPSGRPSQILGAIEGSGQVYVINKNGILFGNGSQINLHTFVASTLPINDDLVSQGLLYNPDAEFLFAADDLSDSSATGDIRVFPGAQLSAPVNSDGKGGRVMLVGANVKNEGTILTDKGQTILAAGLQVGIGAHASNDPSLRGLDVWVGAVGDKGGIVTNSGIIQADEGDIFLTGKTINQFGGLDSTTSVNLNGRIDLHASYGALPYPNYDKVAGSETVPFLNQYTGIVNFGPNSVTRVLPDYASTQTVQGTELPEVSQVNVEGLGIHLGAGASVFAPNGEVNFRAGTWAFRDSDGNGSAVDSKGEDDPSVALSLSGREQRMVYSKGQIYVDHDAYVSVAGTPDVFVPLADSIMTVEFRGNEYADSPLQRTGALTAVPLTIDLRKSGEYSGRYWVGTPLGDAVGLAGLIEHNISQLTAKGGQISMRAGDSLVLQAGSELDVSGGSYQYEGGLVQTTRLLKGGNLIDISDATPDQVYDGVYTGSHTVVNPKWGISQTYQTPFLLNAHYEDGYVGGADAGSISLTAPTMALDGMLRGQSVMGPRQRTAVPQRGTLNLTFEGEEIFQPTPTDIAILSVSPSAPDVLFTQDRNQEAVAPFELKGGEPVGISDSRAGLVLLDPGLFGSDGLGALTVRTPDGNILVPDGVRLDLGPAGSLSLAGANISVMGDIRAPGGNLGFTAYNISPAEAAKFPILNPGNIAPAPSPNTGRGLFLMGQNALIDAKGLFIDDRQNADHALSDPFSLSGGSVSISTFDATLEKGSAIDVSGGIAISSKGSVRYGDAGSIQLLTGLDQNQKGVAGGQLSLNGELSGYSGAKGGALTIQAMGIEIGGKPSSPLSFYIDPGFFQTGGFASYSLRGIGQAERLDPQTGQPLSYLPGLTIGAGVEIQPRIERILAFANGAENGDLTIKHMVDAVGVRSPVNVAFSAIGYDDPYLDPNLQQQVLDAVGLLVMEKGARIAADPGASIQFSGDSVAILGSVEAPGGAITVKGGSSFKLPDGAVAGFALPTVYLGPSASLSAAGAIVYLPDVLGRDLAKAYNGGSISLDGNIVAKPGSVLDVSGASGSVDLSLSALGVYGSPVVPYNSGLNAPLWSQATQKTEVDTNGGSIALHGSEMLFSDATLLGNAGGSNAAGGLLEVSSFRYYAPGAPKSSADINLVVTQSESAAQFGTTSEFGKIVDLMASGWPTIPGQFANGRSNLGIGYFAADRFEQGGFASLNLGTNFKPDSLLPIGGNIEFRGPVTINAPGRVQLARGGVIVADDKVNVNAGYLALGRDFVAPLNSADDLVLFGKYDGVFTAAYNPQPSAGDGVLHFNANAIDVGTTVLQNIGTTVLNSGVGDIRGNGTLSMEGDLKLVAGQVYPTSLSEFNIFVYDTESAKGSVTIRSSSPGETPLSAGGKLAIYASTISQGGVLRAPLGSIRLGWDGTDVDETDADLDKPVDPVSGRDASIAADVTLQKGSLTSVSALDSSGHGLLIPLGVSPDGTSWVDPRGENITVAGLPSKEIHVAGDSVQLQHGAIVDIRAGGDVFAYRWVSGIGGSVDLLGAAGGNWSPTVAYQSGDLVSYQGQTWSARVKNSGETPKVSPYWTRVATSYAILPGYDSAIAPYAPYNTDSNSTLLGGDPGYVASGLSVGDRVYLQGLDGLDAGYYTLLPRRYALLPGAYLIEPGSGSPIGSVSLPAGASLVAGKTFNNFVRGEDLSPGFSRFTVYSPEQIQERVTYDLYTANGFLKEAADRLEIKNPQRLPEDGGYVAFQANHAMQLAGRVLAGVTAGGRASWGDIASFESMYLVDGAEDAPDGAGVVLKTANLNSWGVGSLLIGGLRTETSDGVNINLRSSDVSLDDSGHGLAGSELLLGSRENLTLAPGSSLKAKGSPNGDPGSYIIDGDGAFAGVSANPGLTIVRQDLAGDTTPLLTVGAGADIDGRAVILDSSYGMALASEANISAGTLALGAGQISIVLGSAPAVLEGAVVPQQLVLAGDVLSGLQQVKNLHLSSYRTIDFYGAGEFGQSGLNVNFLASGIRQFGDAGTVQITAADVLLGNPSDVAGLPAPSTNTGDLNVSAQVVHFGQNGFSVDGFENVNVTAAGGLRAESEGSFSTAGNLTLTSPIITGAKRSELTITAGGALRLEKSEGPVQTVAGLGANLNFVAQSITANSKVYTPSGDISLHALSGDVEVNGELSSIGTEHTFYDVIRYTSGGAIELRADQGNIDLGAEGLLTVAAAAGGGDAGKISITVPNGEFGVGGEILGAASTTGDGGKFVLDAKSLVASVDGPLNPLSSLNDKLEAGGFNLSRDIRVRTGDLVQEGNIKVRNYTLSADAGSISVEGTIDASGNTGGAINLIASGDVDVVAGAKLSAHGEKFSSAGAGGSISLEAGSTINGVYDSTATVRLESGALIDLGVDDYVSGDYTTPGSSAFRGAFQGTLHLRAPRNAANTDLAIDPIESTILGASSIVAEGFKVYDLTASGGLITGYRSSFSATPNAATIQGQVYSSANSFLNTANYNAMMSRLLGADTQSLSGVFVLAPGVEILNRTGNLTLGLQNATSLGSASLNSADWNLADFRFGPKKAAGVLTLRAAGDIVFNNALSDGFDAVTPSAANGNSSLWLGLQKTINALLPVNTQSWSYRITAGSDIHSANSGKVVDVTTNLAGGSVLVGQFYKPTPNTSTSGQSAAVGKDGLTANNLRISTGSSDLGTRYEVIRTGAGSITINAARDVQLRNQFATIYTAGVRLPNPQTIFEENDFRLPTFYFSSQPQENGIGTAQQYYGPIVTDDSGKTRRTGQWAMAGGGLMIDAGRDIGRFTQIEGTNVVVPDSTRQLPTNWLYRRGAVDPVTGQFAAVSYDGSSYTDPLASTTWWVDYSNFFEGVGTLGGGDVSIEAGRDVSNIDAVAATNARMAGRKTDGTKVLPDESLLLELGGGDVDVFAGRNLDGGVYYVERGNAKLRAGGEIKTNATREPSFGMLHGSYTATLSDLTWLPTTLFLGKGSFDVSAAGDVLLGPVVNAFLMPPGLNNKSWYRTYFSTYGADSSVGVSSLAGDVTHRLAITLPDSPEPVSILKAWLDRENVFNSTNPSDRSSYYQPWIRLSESDVTGIAAVTTVAAPILKSTAFDGDIHVVGNLNLAPSPDGTLEMLAAGSVVGLNPTGVGRNNQGKAGTAWMAGSINLSDADPATINGIETPSGPISLSSAYLGSTFTEVGSYTGIYAVNALKQALHSADILHANDSEPLRIYAGAGDITALSLFSSKKAEVFAGTDISDVAFYIQNASENSISIVSAGRDIIPFNENTALRSIAGDASAGNIIIDVLQATSAGSTAALPGDIQISGPGTLEVLAGRDLDLGTGSNFVDGRGVGISSIGNFRNPFLPLEGSQIFSMAGVGGADGSAVALGLSHSALDFDTFISEYLADGGQYAATYNPELTALMKSAGLSGEFEALSDEQKAILAMQMFYHVLRDAGRSQSETGAGSALSGYALGFAAISTLFPDSQKWDGDILTRARDVRTFAGGSIVMAAPGGGVTMASDIFGNPQTPPGIVTEAGGDVSVFVNDSVDIGQARIFTLAGGNVTIWASEGNIAAGTAPRTVVTAPPTRVVFDTPSADVDTDLGGLATGGGIGVLAAVAGVQAGDVDLIAPSGVVDAGDAGIRSTGNLNIAATAVVNASNIQAAGASTGVPKSAPVAAPNVSGLTAGSNTTTATSNAANDMVRTSGTNSQGVEEAPSVITAEVIGYGGGDQ